MPHLTSTDDSFFALSVLGSTQSLNFQHHELIVKLFKALKGYFLTLVLFLVGAFQLREKCPTIAVTVFFLQTTILTLIGSLFRNNPETT